MSCRAERGLDSPDSGLPPSPSPSAWLLPVCADKAGGVSPVSEDEGRGSLVGSATFSLKKKNANTVRTLFGSKANDHKLLLLNIGSQCQDIS